MIFWGLLPGHCALHDRPIRSCQPCADRFKDIPPSERLFS